MFQSIFTALSGLRTQQFNIDTIASNVANINTTAYKSSRADFADTLYTLMRRPAESEDYLQNGTGITLGGIQKITDAGAALSTARNLDFMLDGEGYFTLQGAQGQLYFTRDGSFKASNENDGAYLVSAEGHYVLGTNNQRIRLTGDASAVTADGAGALSIGGAVFAVLKITKFTNPAGLADAGGSKLAATASSGTATAAAGAATVRQGWLEGSNVELATELTRLMRAQRIYSALGSALRTADEMDTQANNMA